jgi:hypothetical protein
MTHRQIKSELVKLGRKADSIRDDRISRLRIDMVAGRKLHDYIGLEALFAAYKRGLESSDQEWLLDTDGSYLQCGHYPHWELRNVEPRGDARGPFAPGEAQQWADAWNRSSERAWLGFLNF